MDNFRPTIVVSEIIGNRRDCTLIYTMDCSLSANNDADFRNNHNDVHIHNNHFRQVNEGPPEKRKFRREYWNENGRWVGAKIAKRFEQFEGSSISFKCTFFC